MCFFSSLSIAKTTRGYVFTFGGTDGLYWVEGDGSMLGQRVGLMLGRRGWFDAGLKGMVRIWVEGDGSMLGQNDSCFVFCWGPKLIWREKKLIWWERTGALPKTNLAGTKNWRPNKN